MCKFQESTIGILKIFPNKMSFFRVINVGIYEDFKMSDYFSSLHIQSAVTLT